MRVCIAPCCPTAHHRPARCACREARRYSWSLLPETRGELRNARVTYWDKLLYRSTKWEMWIGNGETVHFGVLHVTGKACRGRWLGGLAAAEGVAMCGCLLQAARLLHMRAPVGRWTRGPPACCARPSRPAWRPRLLPAPHPAAENVIKDGCTSVPNAVVEDLFLTAKSMGVEEVEYPVDVSCPPPPVCLPLLRIVAVKATSWDDRGPAARITCFAAQACSCALLAAQ